MKITQKRKGKKEKTTKAYKYEDKIKIMLNIFSLYLYSLSSLLYFLCQYFFANI